jgi:ornithine carbamoyltransferase
MNFLSIDALGIDGLRRILDHARMPLSQIGRPLEGRGAALIFEKPSNRTRQSMEIAVVQLGGHPVYTRGEEIGFDVRESVEDVTRVMAGYHAVLCARVFDHRVLARMAASVSTPIVNLLSDTDHPLQAVADLLTMEDEFGLLANRTVSWVGDYTNVARSLLQAAALCGMHVRLGCPAGFDASDDELAHLLQLGAASVEQYRDVALAVEGADAVHTDTWISMGQEAQSGERHEIFAGFQVTAATMSHAAPKAIFMHCLPAHRGWEVTDEVIDGSQSRVIPQAHHRLSSARAVLATVMGGTS